MHIFLLYHTHHSVKISPQCRNITHVRTLCIFPHYLSFTLQGRNLLKYIPNIYTYALLLVHRIVLHNSTEHLVFLIRSCLLFVNFSRCCYLPFNQSINQTSIAPISPAKPGSVTQRPNQCSTAKSRKQFRNINRPWGVTVSMVAAIFPSVLQAI